MQESPVTQTPVDILEQAHSVIARLEKTIDRINAIVGERRMTPHIRPHSESEGCSCVQHDF